MDYEKPRYLNDLLLEWKTAVSHSNLPSPPIYSGTNHHLTNIVDHTGHVSNGSCFVARIGITSDGHIFIQKAVELGAVLIIGQHDLTTLAITLPPTVTYLQVEDSSETFAWLSAAWYGFPSHHLAIVGVTGTDGKTTTVNILHQILQSAGLKAGMLSTLKATIGDVEEALALHVTTPEAPVIQKYLRRMVDAGVTHCVLETTSHALAQHRVTAVDFDIAIVTNITHEHLDYHGSHSAYVEAKSRLFEYVASCQLKKELPTPVSKTIILNADDPISYTRLNQIETPNKISYGLSESGELDVYANNIHLAPWSTKFDLHLRATHLPIETKMFGQFNIYNMMAAASAAAILGIAPEQIQIGLNELSQLYGRMQTISKGQSFLVIVDFAHTPNGLEKAIDAARRTLNETNPNGKIITVFGSAGLRDPEKRTLMAQISEKYSDYTVLTAEDPRTESLSEILETMAQGCVSEGGQENITFWRVTDRGEAIYSALKLAQADDLVLICGKGHEQSMCFGTIEYPWDDINATEIAIDAFLKQKPMPDLGLPTFRKNSPDEQLH